LSNRPVRSSVLFSSNAYWDHATKFKCVECSRCSSNIVASSFRAQRMTGSEDLHDLGPGRSQIDRRNNASSHPPIGNWVGREAAKSIALWILPLVDRFLMRFAATDDYEVFPNALFPWTSYLEANWSVIRDEAEGLLRDGVPVPSLRDISPDHKKIALDGKWRSFFFWGYGTRVQSNCARCPETARILEHIPGLLSALYSVMLPGAHVPRHTGPTKAIITAHLGLIIPAKRESCRMQVNGRGLTWKQGRVVIFDDMNPHEVWIDTDDVRIILLLHLRRPLRFPGSAVGDFLVAALRSSPFVRDGVRNLEQWDKLTGSAKRAHL
jgi:ornithine lipid ester-linked acyl 2-hydroxylase